MRAAILYLLAAVFILAALSKFRARAAFRAVLRKLAPAGWDAFLSRLVPTGELLLAAFLLSGFAPRWATLAALLTLCVFTFFLVRMRRIGLEGCACFGEDSNSTTNATGMVRNLILMLGAACIAVNPGSVRLWTGDFSLFLGQLTVVLGTLCLWPSLVAVADRRQFLKGES